MGKDHLLCYRVFEMANSFIRMQIKKECNSKNDLNLIFKSIDSSLYKLEHSYKIKLPEIKHRIYRNRVEVVYCFDNIKIMTWYPEE